jgi:hypothetical protein
MFWIANVFIANPQARSVSRAYRSNAAERCVTLELPIIRVRVIERVMKAAAFFAGECGINDQSGCACEIA